ncbi:hypothetical protein [Paraburkholderia sp. J8-2]|uniref:hypothetical protein n=1 Tax=Paraburkholderia sp. J8-2 TaxID=2805440 RepID=UPI002AB79DD8|nr:hypothetical protein [Paraburkholderia sp. J8-2]
MNLRRFFTNYLLIPLGMPAIAAAMATYHVMSEVEPAAYATLSMAWPHLHEGARHDIAKAVAANHGKISNWTYRALFDRALDDTGGLEMPGSNGSLKAERDKLQSLIDSDRANG